MTINLVYPVFVEICFNVVEVATDSDAFWWRQAPIAVWGQASGVLSFGIIFLFETTNEYRRIDKII